MLSHWDRIPPELQSYIMDLKYRQKRLDTFTVERRRLCQQMRLYHAVKDRWRIGRVACHPYYCSICNEFHMRLYGHYRDQRVMLGYSLNQAMCNMAVAKDGLLNSRIHFVL